MFTKQTDGKFEKWVESGLSTFEIRRLVAEIYFIYTVIATLLRRLADVSRPPTKKACLTAIDALFGGIMLVALAFG